MDPVTLFALANGAVKLVKEGCKLYKDIKGAAGDVKDVLKDLDDQYHKKFSDRAPTVAERNQYIEEKNRIIALNKRDGETANIYQEIGNHLGTYYDNYYKCKAVFDEEEKRSKTEVYTGEESLGRRALQRELMVYQSPPELGALYTEVEEMMKRVGKEQAGAIQIQMRRNEEQARIRAKKQRRLQYKIMCWSLTLTAAAYLVWLAWATVQLRIERHPELGVCLLPKGAPLYKQYNNLIWVDCEINLREAPRDF